MITLLLIFLPLAGLLAVWGAGDRLKVHVWVINITAVLHCLGSALLWIMPEWDDGLPEKIYSLVGQDILSRTVLSVISLLFLLFGLLCEKMPPN